MELILTPYEWNLVYPASQPIVPRKRIRLPKRLLTLAELAIYLDVSCVTLYELIEHEDNGNFPAIRIGDEWYVALDDVPEWLLRLSDKRGT
ncbi:MAG: helix-turn-helix domain-containing protein [Candidatus Binataceae bacterium]